MIKYIGTFVITDNNSPANNSRHCTADIRLGILDLDLNQSQMVQIARIVSGTFLLTN